ncbi:MAG: glycosyltransferase family 2 protein, partial [Candidatus Promineifilaceae bacterium]|nr:glycosyltransferase family 2 protein [Candidatus Promineifilaceae bacterium]
DYPNYEVLLVDNNTPEEEKWRPLEAACRELGPHFRCLHLDQWPGYKSGALNFALAQTAPDAEIVGIVDADYHVVPHYLSELVPAFADSEVAFVQTPQDYRDFDGNRFLEACYNAYKYFFDISMPSRNEYNAIIFGGTMGLIRKSVLQEIGGWDEWCITEDAEASLRILKRGYRSIFVNRTYGRGLMPFSFEGLKKQRFRWCFGGVQILKKHWKSLLPGASMLDPHNRLTRAQRYWYLIGGLQWFNEVLNLTFVVFLLLGALLLLSPLSTPIRPAVAPLVIIPAVFLALGMWRFLWALRYALRLSFGEALAAMANFFSLSWSVALGAVQGLIQPQGVFMRTPKSKSRSGVVRALTAARWETGIGLTCAVVAVSVLAIEPRPGGVILAALLLWQSGLYLAAPTYSLLSTYGEEFPLLTSRDEIRGGALTESRAARQAVALVFLLLLGGLVLHTFPTPDRAPTYARLQPAKVPVERLLGLERVPFEQRGIAPPEIPEDLVSPTPTPTSTPTVTPTPVATSPGSGGTARPSPSPSPQSPQPTATPLPSRTTSPSSTPTEPPPTSTATATPSRTRPGPTAPPPPTSPAPTQPPAPTSPAPTVPAPTQPPQPTSPAPTQPPQPTSPAPTVPAPTQPPQPTSPGRP